MEQYNVSDVIDALCEAFPLDTQDGWDNSGLLVGDADAPLRGVMLTVDITPEVIEAAQESDCNLVVAHHPIMFKGVRNLTGATPEQRMIMTALRSGIALAAFHTPADKSMEGTSGTLGNMLGLKNMTVLAPDESDLVKVMTFAPPSHSIQVKAAAHSAGAGHLGVLSKCSWTTNGIGECHAQEATKNTAGQKGCLFANPEDMILTMCRRKDVPRVIEAIQHAHPYDNPLIETFEMTNTGPKIGYGVVGELEHPLSADSFLYMLKEKLGGKCVRHTEWPDMIGRVAICTGSGSEFIGKAIAAGADAYVTADLKYHQMADAAHRIMLADVGHYESESITKNIFKEVIKRKLPNFAFCKIYKESNPIKYY